MNRRRSKANDFKRRLSRHKQSNGPRQHDRRCVRKSHWRLRMNHHHAAVVALAAVATSVVILPGSRLSEARERAETAQCEHEAKENGNEAPHANTLTLARRHEVTR